MALDLSGAWAAIGRMKAASLLVERPTKAANNVAGTATQKAVRTPPEAADRAGLASTTKTSAIAVVAAAKVVDEAGGMATRWATPRLLAGAGSVRTMARAVGTVIRKVTLAPPAAAGRKAAAAKDRMVLVLGMRTTIGKATKVVEVLRNMTTSAALRAAVEAEANATDIGSYVSGACEGVADYGARS
jgi:hypothetical protein